MKTHVFTVGVVGLLALGACGGSSASSITASACIAAASCQVAGLQLSECSFDVHGFSIDAYALQAHVTVAEVECIAAAGSNCDGVRKCLNGGQAPSACTGGASCDGKNLVLCQANLSSPGVNGTNRFDCGSVGLDCVANNNTIDCGLGTCSGLSSSCNGNKVTYCLLDGIQREYDCGTINATCNPSGLVAHCRGSGAACTQTSTDVSSPAIRCDGSKIVYCADGQESTFDCGSIGLKCFPNLDGSPFMCADSNACDTNYGSTCGADGKLTFCNSGKIDTFDCKRAGYSSCTPNNGGGCVK